MNTVGRQSEAANDASAKSRRCFVISPIGEEGTVVRAHADDVMEYIIKPALDRCDVVAVRSDQIAEGGTITDQMFHEIVTADVCVALLTGLNPNVFYELAVAQSAARPVIMLIEKGLTLPFDVKDLRCIQYEMFPISRLVKGTYADRVEEMLEEIKRQAWTAPNLFEHYGAARKLDDERQLRRMLQDSQPEILPFGRDKRYALPGDPDREICLLTGDLKDLETESFGADVIVSPENTDLQLACYYDADSISAGLRYLDAERSSDGRLSRDCLDESLQKRIQELHIVLPMVPGRVIATRTTRLGQKYGIKYVFHAATLQGEIGDGYRMMGEVIDDCVGCVFDLFAEMAPTAGLSSILFPMLGAATADLTPLEVARKILRPIVRKMSTIASCRKTVILARLESHRQAVYRTAADLGLKELS